MPEIEYVWRPQAGPQHALVQCPLPEVFFGGARGGGKTDGVLGKWALKEERYGRAFNARMFRRNSIASEDAIERAKQIYTPLGAKFSDKPARFRMPHGGRVAFDYLDSIQDADNQQGKNLTDAWVEEAGQYADPAPIDRLFGALRSAEGVPIQMILTGNPGGVGQHWLAARYKLIPFPSSPSIVTRELPNGAKHSAAVIPSRITDNKVMLASDPEYINRLQLVGSPALVRAWLEGDWSAIEGAFFPEWSEAKHVIQPFEIPAHWTRFRSGDWGSARPFSIGWWAVVSDEFLLGDRSRRLPRGAMVRYREWYGASAPNVGLKLTAEQVAAGIVERERHEPRDIRGEDGIIYGVLDPAAFASDGGPSIAERMAHPPNGVLWRRADNARVSRNGALGGWDQVRARLVGDGERPAMYFFSTCRDSIRTLPALQHDRAKAEDVDTDSEDHAPDEIRYGCMSRPYVTDLPEVRKPKFLQDATLEDMWETNEVASRRGRI